MPLKFVSGDPLLTKCAILALAHNTKGQTEMDVLTQRIMQKCPPAFSNYEQRCRKNKQNSGDLFLWAESKPKLLFLTVRDSGVGATRLRYVQKCLMTIARDYKLLTIKSLAIAPIGNAHERSEIKSLYETWFGKLTPNIIVYENYEAGLEADESFSDDEP